MMKKRTILVFNNSLIIALLLILTGCKKTTDTDVPPQLEITATDTSDKAVEGAIITLFATIEDWKAKTKPVKEGTTNASGVTEFTELETKVYYFYVAKGTQTNYVGAASTGEALKNNTKATVTTVIK